MHKYFSGYFNLLKTAIGSGILSYPFLFKTYGYAMVTAISVISAMFSFIGLLLYLICMTRVGPGSTFSSLAQASNLRTSLFADIAICIKCIGVSISYLIIIRQLLPLVLIYVFNSSIYFKPRVCLLLFLLVTSPLSYFSKISKLKYTSLCGLLCIFIVICMSFFRFENATHVSSDVVPITSFSILWLTGIGKVVFSFTCHQNIFSVHNEIRDNNLKKSTILAFCTIFTALCVYLTFGFLNYLVYGPLINVDILETYPEDTMTVVVQALYVIVMGFSYPLQINPCKFYLIEMFGLADSKNKSMIEFGITTALIAITFTVAASGINLGVVYSLIGSIASSLVCMILPAIFYKSIIGGRGGMYILANMTLLFGVFVFLSFMATVNGINFRYFGLKKSVDNVAKFVGNVVKPEQDSRVDLLFE